MINKDADPSPKPLAIGARLKDFPDQVTTLGFKPNFNDYTPKEQHWIAKAPKIYYPTAFYADLFNAMGKPTFPSFHTYKFAQDKILQTAIFNLNKIPHPRTRVFYGSIQKSRIKKAFDAEGIEIPWPHTKVYFGNSPGEEEASKGSK